MNVEKHHTVPGLYYIKNIIKNGDLIIDLLDKEEWYPFSSAKNSRLVQHYGYKYNYKTYKIDEKTKPIPDYLEKLKDKLTHVCKHLKIKKEDEIFNQCIVNNYFKGQRISKHIDVITYGDIVACFTVGNSGVMRFTKGDKVYDIEPEPNSLYIMSGDARYKWRHKMLTLKNERRISITFRIVPD